LPSLATGQARQSLSSERNQAMIGKLSERKPRPSAVTIRRIEAAVERERELAAMREAGR
jgi:hypothetical protein